ncbi:DUF456 domain-containing protein [Sanguibacter antarcticus]|uniref:DUF456 family protein n=1 Tax=Sanguibacter antarcticus TaxID=372484 RepID=A0A2A9E6R5_9MICO|nr:DUF456 domain-containing protein [Sanguibacter antarcticus]PFG33899.1 hypothetical protein ATL42_1793 [Sanguibacter antarcticus]
MNGLFELLVGLVILVGLFGAVTQIIPGSIIVLVAVGVWSAVTGGVAAWVVFGVGLVAVVVAAIIKYVLAGRHLKNAEVPGSTLVVGGVLGIVGFFVVPVVGLPIGFVGGVYLAELSRRHDQRLAWTSTKAALAATGITIVVELAGALVATGAWVVGLLVT